MLSWGLGGLAALAAAGAGGVELVLHGVLPGHATLDRAIGACCPPAVATTSRPPGPSIEATFVSRARQRRVGYTIAYPPGHDRGSALPLVIALHGYGGNHSNVLAHLSLPDAAALLIGGQPLPPMAIVSVDGGGGYWHPHPGDDPMGMLVNELIPMCQGLGLGKPPQRIGVIGLSMGAYGGLLLAEQHPGLVAAVAAISPAVWIRYSEAHNANPGAFANAQDFAAHDVIAHAKALGGTPIRIASGQQDPFHPGVEALIAALPPGATVVIGPGGHDETFESSQQPDSLAFLATHLVL